MLRLFFVCAIPCLKLNVVAVLERGDGRSPVPPAITSNHGPMNRLLRIWGRKNSFLPGRVSSKAENDNALYNDNINKLYKFIIINDNDYISFISIPLFIFMEQCVLVWLQLQMFSCIYLRNFTLIVLIKMQLKFFICE